MFVYQDRDGRHVRIAKNRSGPCESLEVIFDGARTKFRQADQQDHFA